MTTRADEGMWLFNNPPRAKIKADYGFEITDAWLEHVSKASVRFNSGGSGSFVSGDGLVITNHHVGADALQKMSSEEHNYLKEGFYAKTSAEEIKCVDLELNVLDSIEDVTVRVNAAVPATLKGTEAALARRKAMAEIEKESREKTGLRSDVVTLYQGGQYHLYRYKRYTDIRLVFAPEQQIAFFGGDPDNFEYPRYDLDICLFRVYENGAPVKPAHFLKWSKAGAAENELVFMSGNPGHTDRLLTQKELEYQRDVAMPYTLFILKRREVMLTAFSGRSLENARRAREQLFSIQNSRKARDGAIAALQDPAFFAEKAKSEAAFRERLAGKPEFADAATAFKRIEDAQAQIKANAIAYRMLEGGLGFSSESFGIARSLLRAGDERPKANGERLREYSEAKRESFEFSLFSDKPIYEDLETLNLADGLSLLVETLGLNDPLVVKILDGKAPKERAAELIKTTQVRDVAFRRKLYEGGAAAVAAAKDPLIELARLVDADARAVRKIMEAQDEGKSQAYAAIAKARYALEGASSYPDATFTLRLTYGSVAGYEEAGAKVPFQTTVAGLYERSAKQGNREPFDLPQRWADRKAALDLNTPMNFVSTCDIIGGNSGSPTINKEGEFVGIVFDGNLQSLAGNYYFDIRQNRALSVHSSAILEALRKVYQVDALADELVTGHR